MLSLANDPKKRKRFVIFADDLDRCLEEKSVEIFESIKLFLNCENCVFVIGVDKEQIRKIFQTKFQTQDEQRGISYVEKFVQLEFDLPPKTPDEVKEFMLENASVNLKEAPDTVELISEFIEPNPRKIKRWLNSVLFLEKLFRLKQDDAASTSSKLDIRVASIWLFLKASFPHFSTLIATKPSILNEAIELAKKNPDERKEMGNLALDERLIDFLSRLKPDFKEPQLRDLVHLTRYTPVADLSASTSVYDLQYMIREITVDLDKAILEFSLFVQAINALKTPLLEDTKIQSSELLGQLNKLMKEANKMEHDIGHRLDVDPQLNIIGQRGFRWRIDELSVRVSDAKESITKFQEVLLERLKREPSLYKKFKLNAGLTFPKKGRE